MTAFFVEISLSQNLCLINQMLVLIDKAILVGYNITSELSLQTESVGGAKLADSENAEKTRVKTKIHNAVRKIDRLETFYEACDYTLKNRKKALPILALALKRLFYRKNTIFLLATPTHGNRGDHLIVYAMKKWCEQYLPDYVLLEYDDRITENPFYLSLLKAAIKKKDFIFLRGGGSVGDWYFRYEYFIRQVLTKFKKNKIIMFPQSINFSATPFGLEEKTKTTFSYDSHPNFTFCVRDKISFEQAKTMFSHTKLLLCPDIATFLFSRFSPQRYERSGVLLCLRTDKKEIFYSDLERHQMTQSIKNKYSVKFGDTEAGHKIFPEQREEEIEKMLRLFSESRVVVTDRYHGIISAVLTKTPCVALRSTDHKIVSGIQWFAGLESVFYAENIEDVPELVEKAMLCENSQIPDFRHYFDELHEETLSG